MIIEQILGQNQDRPIIIRNMNSIESQVCYNKAYLHVMDTSYSQLRRKVSSQVRNKVSVNIWNKFWLENYSKVNSQVREKVYLQIWRHIELQVDL